MKKQSSRRFSATQQTTIKDLQRIMTKISASSLRIEQSVMDGEVKVIFDRNGKRYVRECKRWPDSLDNLRAIGLQIDYLYRALEVYGVDMSESNFDQEFDNVFAGYLATPDSSALLLGDGQAKWWDVLGVKPEANIGDIRNAYRALARIYHPDAGGSEEDFKRLNKAFEEATKNQKGH
jgi:hypothetical protein